MKWKKSDWSPGSPRVPQWLRERRIGQARRRARQEAGDALPFEKSPAGQGALDAPLEFGEGGGQGARVPRRRRP